MNEDSNESPVFYAEKEKPSLADVTLPTRAETVRCRCDRDLIIVVAFSRKLTALRPFRFEEP